MPYARPVTGLVEQAELPPSGLCLRVTIGASYCLLNAVFDVIMRSCRYRSL